MPPAPPALIARIEHLQREFQAVADRHSWVCLHDPTRTESGTRVPFAGARVAFHVVRPADLTMQVVTHHVDSLTSNAAAVLSEALQFITPHPDENLPVYQPNPSDPFGYEAGWVRWLRYTTVVNRPWVENYPQAAVSGLGRLIQRCLSTPSQATITPGNDPAAKPSQIPDWIREHFYRGKQFPLLCELWGKNEVPATVLYKALKYTDPNTQRGNLERRVVEVNKKLAEKVDQIGANWEIRRATVEGVVHYRLRGIKPTEPPAGRRK